MKVNLVIVTARRLEYALAGLWKKVKDYVQASIQPPQKEVIQCYAYSADIQPENEEDGNVFIDVAAGKLYVVEQGTLKSLSPEPECIYVQFVPDESPLMYVYTGGKFELASQVADSNVLIISSLNELDNVTTPGLYTVQLVASTYSTVYTLSVENCRVRSTQFGTLVYFDIRQKLISESGYSYRYRTTENEWRSWSKYTYSFTDHSHEIGTIYGLEARLKKLEQLAAAGL